VAAVIMAAEVVLALARVPVAPVPVPVVEDNQYAKGLSV